MRSRSSGTWRRPAVAPALGSISGWPLIRIVPPATGRMPASASSSSDWPLPATPAMPTISPARTCEAHALDPVDAGAIAHGQARAPRAPARRGCAGSFSTRSSTLRPTISSASSSRRGLGGPPVRHHCALAHDARRGRSTAMISRSLWVISTTVRPCVPQVAQNAEQMVCLLRRQDAGRLVQDQDRGRRGTGPSGSRPAAGCRPAVRRRVASRSTSRPYSRSSAGTSAARARDRRQRASHRPRRPAADSRAR